MNRNRVLSIHKNKKHRARKRLLILAGSVLLLAALFILLASPLVKYLVEKKSEKLTGRKITMDWAYVNPFTGLVNFNNFRIYEAKKDTLFFSARSVTADFSIMRLFSGTVEITGLIVDHPSGVVIQTKKHFNFDDLILRFSPDPSSQNRSSVHVNILHIQIKHGEFYYREKAIPINYAIKDLSMESSGKRWDADTIASTFSFLSQDAKGGIKGNFTINVKNQEYRLATSVQDFDLEIIRQYLWELINYGVFSAKLDATIHAIGNFKDPGSIDMHGRFSFTDFHLGKTVVDNYAAFDKLKVVIERVSPVHKIFYFDSIILRHPFLKYEEFDSLNNVEMLFGRGGANISDATSQGSRFNLVIEIGRYLKKLSQNFFQSQYKVNTFLVTNGDLKFSDFSLNEQFGISANSLSITADSVNKDNKRIAVQIKSGIKPFGDLSITLGINPKDSGDFDMHYHLNKIPASLFNPYLISYTSFPVDRGMINLNGVWNVRNGEIKSVNHVVVIEPRISNRLKNKNLKWIPLPWVMPFVRERSNVIDYDIPISGDLKNPRFHLHDVLMDLLKNIVIKPVSIPYSAKLRTAEDEIENFHTLRWNLGQHELRGKQKYFIRTIAEFLDENKTSSITVYTNDYSLKEKEQILFFEAKKKYFIATHREKVFKKEDSIKVNKMSIKEAAFMHALKRGKGAGDTLMFTIQDKCNYYVGGSNSIDSKYLYLVKERDRIFQEFFIKNGTADRVKIFSNHDSVPYNGFSYYKIIYHGNIPESLQRAYRNMVELNNDEPRAKYKSDLELPELK
jgi:Domain of Unknown Function (DUF748)